MPEKVARGSFATGVLVLQAANEFVLDFLLRMNQPHQVSARVILPVSLIPQLIDALKANLENYKKTFGVAPPQMPMPNPPPTPPSIDEIYRDLKIADETLMGAYANSGDGRPHRGEASSAWSSSRTSTRRRSSRRARVYLERLRRCRSWSTR